MQIPQKSIIYTTSPHDELPISTKIKVFLTSLLSVLLILHYKYETLNSILCKFFYFCSGFILYDQLLYNVINTMEVIIIKIAWMSERRSHPAVTLHIGIALVF